MSGTKAAEVRPKLQRAIRIAENALRESEKNAENLRSLSVFDFVDVETKAEELARRVGETNASEAVQKFCAEDVRSLEERRRRIVDLVDEGERERQTVDELRAEAEALRNRAAATMRKVVAKTERIERTLRRQDWFLDREDAEAVAARFEAEDALRLEKDAADKLRRAADASRRAKTAFESALFVGERLESDFENLERIAAEREAAAQIAEKNRREAVSFGAEIDGFFAALKTLNVEKFAPGGFGSETVARFSNEIAAFRKSLIKEEFETAARLGKTLVSRLREFVREIAARQTAFETARNAAQNALDSARKETAFFNRDELLRWSDDQVATNGAYSTLDEARRRFDAEDFAEVERLVASATEFLRENAKRADERKALSNSRCELAEAVMNALCEQGYDAPTFYYERQNADGSDVEFSDLTIFAKAPGNKGDMRLQVDLEGKIELEVEGIAEGEEAVCRQALETLQEGVGAEIDFRMTDWGRATQAKDAQVVYQKQDKTLEKTRERQ